MKLLLRPGLLVLLAMLATEVRSQPPSPSQAVAVSVAAAPASSTPDGFAPALETDPARVMTEPEMPKPAYLARVNPAPFGVPIMRITNDPGLPTIPVPGTWGTDARHVYSKQQPWNSDNTLLVIENHGGGSPTEMILDGATYLPKYAPCDNYNHYDFRWHPSRSHPHEQINVDRTGTELMWFDVVACTKTRSWALPITVDEGIGSGEGNPSNDGRFVALGNNAAMFVVDMDPQPPYPPYPSVRIGPVYTYPPESLTTAAPGSWTIDNLSVSPSGRYVVVKFGSADDCGSYDMERVFEVDPGTLALKPHNMATGSLRCCSFQSRPNGWIFPLKHPDLALDPFDHDEDVMVGGRACPGSTIGHVVMVRLRNGAVTPLTDPDHEAPVAHVSTRNLDRPAKARDAPRSGSTRWSGYGCGPSARSTGCRPASPRRSRR